MEQVEKGQVKSLIKALELVDILSRNQAPMTLQELHQTSGYPKSTIYSLLSTLRTYGCIRQEADGRYYLGTKLFQWGCGVYASGAPLSGAAGAGHRCHGAALPRRGQQHHGH